MGCCGQKAPKQDFLIIYKGGARDGETEQVAASVGVMEVRRRILAGGGGTFKMVPAAK